MSLARLIPGALLILCTSALPLLADTIKLHGGGVVQGQILEHKSTKSSLVVKLQIGGGEIKLARSKVLEIIREKSPLEEYEKIKDQFAETPEDQFKLAMWCERSKLSRQRREHLLKVIELDPDHSGARTKLGYVRREGKWLTRRELKEAKGLVRYRGRYVTPQEKEILERKKREEETTREWHKRVRRWKAALTGDDPAQSSLAEQNLRAIDDPLAIPAITRQFGKQRSEKLRGFMCEILADLPGQRATLELVKRSIVDASANVRWVAGEKLVEREDPRAVKALTDALRSEHNIVIRRAAEALGTIGDPSAVLPLIGALVTKHKKVANRGAPSLILGPLSTPQVVDVEAVVAPGAIAFSPTIGYRAQGAGLGLGNTTREVVVVSLENPEVLDALEAITEENFGYNKAAWRRWYQTQLRKEELRNRRRIDRR